MKFFSLISSAAALTMLSASGFCENQMTDLESRVSDMEKTKSSSVITYSNTSNGQSSQMRMDDHERRLQNLEYQNGSSSSTQQMQKNVLTTARGCPGTNGPYFDIEFLWLRAVEDELNYGWKGTQEDDASLISAKALDQDWEFDPGFRVGLGYNFDYDDWDLHAYYTWLYSYPSTSASIPPQPINGPDDEFIVGLFALQPVNQGSLVFELFENVNSSWQLQFNAWDLELGRNYFVGKSLALQPVVGLKGALIRQHLNVHYTTTNTSFTFADIYVRCKSRYWGVGPKVGVFGSWDLGYGFSINGDVHGALLYGEFTTRFSQNGIQTDGDLFNLRLTDNSYRLRPMAYLNLGLEWGRCFWEWMFFSFHVGWECQYWWDQMEFTSFKDITPEGALALTGLNAGFRFDF